VPSVGAWTDSAKAKVLGVKFWIDDEQASSQGIGSKPDASRQLERHSDFR